MIMVGAVGSNVNLTVQYSTFDGLAWSQTCSSVCLSEAIVNRSATGGNLTIHHSAFIGTHQHVVQFNTPGTLQFRYNYAEGIGYNGAHGDWTTSFYGGGSPGGAQFLTTDFSVAYQPGDPLQNATGLGYIENLTTGTNTASWTGGYNYDTLVAVPIVSGPNVGAVSAPYLIRFDPQTTGTTTYTVSLTHNWMACNATGGCFTFWRHSSRIFREPRLHVRHVRLRGEPSLGNRGADHWTCPGRRQFQVFIDLNSAERPERPPATAVKRRSPLSSAFGPHRDPRGRSRQSGRRE